MCVVNVARVKEEGEGKTEKTDNTVLPGRALLQKSACYDRTVLSKMHPNRGTKAFNSTPKRGDFLRIPTLNAGTLFEFQSSLFNTLLLSHPYLR